jgi:hypothetical protein
MHVYIHIHTYTDFKLGWEARKLTDDSDGVLTYILAN